MVLSTLDWIIIAVFLLLILAVGFSTAQQASKNTRSFFLGGQNLPWWIAGTSMVATTFAADTPLLVTELVAKNGISGNWLWWNGLIGGMLTTFFFARLWRRSGVITDVEFTEMRYSGKPASFLRGFKAVYLGVFMNCVIIAWVNLALMALLEVFFEIPQDQTLYYAAAAMVFVALYVSVSGLLGVAYTDVIQFVLAMAGCILLAYLVITSNEIGGMAGLKAALPADAFSFFPALGETSTSVGQSMTVFSIGIATFFAYVAVQWWASWYPGAEPGGGGYIAQRMMSAKNESHALKATLFFQLAHIGIRPWPWVLVALASVVLYPELGPDDKKLGFVMAMRDFLPDGLRGLLLVAFLAAYMSTISTQLNWGASYMVNDVYARFFNRSGKQEKLVLISRYATFLIMVVGLITTTLMTTLEQAFVFMIECGAGLGMVLILRWYWWRINAWSEITATFAPFVGYTISRFVLHLEFPFSLFFTISITTASWLAVTYFTKPEPMELLTSFYLKIKPGGSWAPVAKQLAEKIEVEPIGPLFLFWVLGIVMIYSFLFGVGSLLFSDWPYFALYTTTFLLSGTYLWKKV